MAAVTVNRVQILNNPAAFADPLALEIEYECCQALKEDLEWKIIYVGSAESDRFDQTLDAVMVGPVMPGQYKFVFEADAPDVSKLPSDDVVGVTALLLTCSYKGKEFVRVGYYVNNDYAEEDMRLAPPEVPVIAKLSRSILDDHPLVTKYAVAWDEPLGEGQLPAAPPEEAMEVEGQGA